MVTVYPAYFYKEEDGGYSVVFPDLNYLATQGDDLSDAMSMAIDCLAGYVHSELEEGKQIPEPSDISVLDPIKYMKKEFPDSPSSECFATYVSVDVKEYAKKHFERSVKKTLTIPYWLNKLALKNNINFSKVLKEALIEKLL